MVSNKQRYLKSNLIRIIPWSIVFLSIVLIVSVFADEQQETDKPPIPYYDWGACPSEGCAFKEWTAKKDTILRADHKESSPVVAKIKAGEKVEGLNGVVITTKPGVVKIIKKITLDKEKKILLNPGDIIYFTA